MKHVVFLSLISAFVLAACTSPQPQSQGSSVPPGAQSVQEQQSQTPSMEAPVSENEGGQESVAMQGNVREFAVKGTSFAFDVKQIKVKKGETVRITFTNSEGMHDWVVDEFDVRTKVLKAGEQETIEFVADSSGIFEYYCSVGAHRAQGMKGSLIVE